MNNDKWKSGGRTTNCDLSFFIGHWSFVISFAALSGVCSLMLGACATLQVPSKAPSFPFERYLNASREGVVVRAYPIEHYEDYWELFEEDLPKIGLGVLWVRIDNTRAGAISLKDARWTLRKGERTFSSLDAKDVLKQFYSGQGIRMYSVAAHEKARKGLEGFILKGRTIPPSGFLEGFLFFKTDPPGNSRWSTGATLSGRDIQLEARKEIEIELPISNANPGC
jgi:hypothetical protein